MTEGVQGRALKRRSCAAGLSAPPGAVPVLPLMLLIPGTGVLRLPQAAAAATAVLAGCGDTQLLVAAPLPAAALHSVPVLI